MKIEFEIADINRDEVIAAMAQHLMTRFVANDGDGSTYRSHSELADRLGKAVQHRIDELAAETIRTCFDETIRARIGVAVDQVLTEGWFKTDSYGNRQGERIDLKGRISEIITESKNSGYGQPKRTLAEELVTKTVSEVFSKQFTAEIDAARARLREQLDATVSAKFVETVKAALGLR